MSYLLLGADGQVGHKLRTALAGHGPLLAVGRAGHGPWDGELGHVDGLRALVRDVRPKVIVNAAAWTDVDGAEAQPGAAFAANATACGVLAEEAQALGSWLIHYSTDFVFDGSGERPWREDDVPRPVNAYGASKLAGEQAIQAACPRHLILRIGWVYEAGGRNFVNAIRAAAASKDELSVVDDQWGAPSRASWVAGVTADILRRQDGPQPGLFHLAPAGFTSRYLLARHIVERAHAAGAKLQVHPERILPRPTTAQPGIAARPLNTRLDTSRLQAVYGVQVPPWGQALDALIDAFVHQPPP